MIDSHAHICEERLTGIKDGIIASMRGDGLSALIEVGCDPVSSAEAAALASENENVFALIGTYPEFAESFKEEDLNFYAGLAACPKVVGIGEIGLDYHYETPPREIQKKVFERQLLFAAELKLPACLHVRDAYGDLLAILAANKNRLGPGLLMHCYGGSAEFVRELAEYDCYFAFGGVVTFKNAKKADIIRAVPQDRLLVETDCPYMAPVPVRGTLNVPANVRYVIGYIAETLGKSFGEIEELTERNTRRLFGRMGGSSEAKR